jgi:FG-GAP-like repeat/FG-GAP repeat
MGLLATLARRLGCVALAGIATWAAPQGALAQSCPDLAFGSTAAYAVGSIPRFVAVGDFNGDGSLDLAVANSGSNSVSILLSDDISVFVPGSSLAVSSPSSIAIADFDKDGNLDLAVTSVSTVSVFLGAGTGGFGPAANYGAFSSPSSLVAADFNGDGNLDLAVNNSSSNLVSVLLGTGIGTFGSATHFTVGSVPSAIAAGDFDGDGKLDLVATNQANNSVSLLLGTGTGGFGAATNFATGTEPVAVAVGDFNADGKLDVAVATYSFRPSVSILLGTGMGSFVAPSFFDTGSGARSIAVGDFNRDGNADLAVANYLDDTVSILPGTGTGAFAPALNIGAGARPEGVATGDFNGDGKPDLVATNSRFGDNTVTVVFNTCQAPSRLFTVTPCRVADTRNAPGPAGGPALTANATRVFPVAGRCSIPPTATAVAVNVTVVDETDAGDLRLFPTRSLRPGSSTINFTAGNVRANNAVIALGSGGKISVQCDMLPGSPGQTHFLIDIAGYFQ